jgi:hypothetical protein
MATLTVAIVVYMLIINGNNFIKRWYLMTFPFLCFNLQHNSRLHQYNSLLSLETSIRNQLPS